jgi:hypothetical protein
MRHKTWSAPFSLPFLSLYINVLYQFYITFAMHRDNFAILILIGLVDAQLFHPVAQGAGLHVKFFGCAVRAFDNPVGLFQHGQDMLAADRLKTGVTGCL